MRRKREMVAAEDDLRKRLYSGISLPKDDFERGMIEGKLSALHWALGKDWDFWEESPSEKRRTAMRKKEEVWAAEEEYFERIWFGRNSKFILNEDGEEILVPRFEMGAGAFERIKDTYGEEALIPEDDFEWGVWSGRLSALRWIMGDEWDFLDT